MKAMIIFLVFVMQSAAQLLFAQNLTIEVCDIEKVEGHLYVAIYNSEETFMKKPLTAFRIDVKDTSLSILARGYLRVRMPFRCFKTRTETGNWILPFSAFLQRSTGSVMMLKALWVRRLMTNAASLFPETRLW